jgi:glutamyl-tRNA reductase
MLVSLAVDFRSADVATREQFHVGEAQQPALVRRLAAGLVREVSLVFTCNRAELYAVIDSVDLDEIDDAISHLARRWMKGRSASADALLATAVRRYEADVVRHLVRVAAGLESQILGDGQILGQVKHAYRIAGEAGTIGPLLHRLFETALRAGKRVQTETPLTTGRHSIGAEAAAVAAQRFGTLTHARVVMVGCGKTGTRAARQVHKLGARDLVLLNRSRPKADELAASIGGRPGTLEAAHLEVAMADIAIVATASSEAVLFADALGTARRHCGAEGQPLLLLDLGVPRNIDANVVHLAGVTLVDLDTLHTPIVAAEAMRERSVPEAERICQDETGQFLVWLRAMPARDAIRPLREAIADVCRREVAFAAGDDVAQRATERIVAKLLAGPMTALRHAIERGEALDTHAMMLFDMFAPQPGARQVARTSEPARARRSAPTSST